MRTVMGNKESTLPGLIYAKGCHPIATVLRSATAVKTSQDENLILTFDSEP